jgi:hypothetical protein
MILKQARGIEVDFGGEEPSGWMPPGATTPLPTPVERELVDVRIVSDGSGYVLEWAARSSATNRDPKPPKTGDLWYERLADAEAAAEDIFGLTADDWEASTQGQ